MAKRLTLEIVKDKLKNINPNVDILSNEYISAKSKLECKCLIDNNEWETTWDSLSHGSGCPMCGNKKNSESKKILLEDVKNKIKIISPNILILDEFYKQYKNNGVDRYYKCRCLIDGHEWNISHSKIMAGGNCKVCHHIKISDMQRFTIEGVKVNLGIINPNIEILSDEYINNHTYMKCKCLICNCEWDSWYSNLAQGQGCPNCARTRRGIAKSIPKNNNSIRDKRPDLIKYLKHKEDADRYTFKSNKYVDVICPNCNTGKIIKINDLESQGFGCSMCSDGLSVPEKFGINLFKQLNVEFETQKTFNWSNRKRYDKYFKLINDNYIIEIHGIQHYEESSRGRSLKDEQENDKLKYNLAIENYIKAENYIVIDARYSELNWLKENFTKQLSHIFDLSNVNWLEIWETSQSSILPKVCEYWSNRNEFDTATSVSKVFGLSNTTIIKYLKIGAKLGICNYDSKNKHKM